MRNKLNYFRLMKVSVVADTFIIFLRFLFVVLLLLKSLQDI
jgi:hypothetical protein